jgi:DNA-binding transcriptional MerR regulator
MNDGPLTVGGLARASDVSEASIRTYARKRLIEFTVDSAGRKLFEKDIVPRVKALYRQRVASRGRQSPR